MLKWNSPKSNAGKMCNCCDLSETWTRLVRGHLAEILPSSCPRSARLLAGICWEKVKAPALPRG